MFIEKEASKEGGWGLCLCLGLDLGTCLVQRLASLAEKLPSPAEIISSLSSAPPVQVWRCCLRVFLWFSVWKLSGKSILKCSLLGPWMGQAGCFREICQYESHRQCCLKEKARLLGWEWRSWKHFQDSLEALLMGMILETRLPDLLKASTKIMIALWDFGSNRSKDCLLTTKPAIQDLEVGLSEKEKTHSGVIWWTQHKHRREIGWISSRLTMIWRPSEVSSQGCLGRKDPLSLDGHALEDGPLENLLQTLTLLTATARSNPGRTPLDSQSLANPTNLTFLSSTWHQCRIVLYIVCSPLTKCKTRAQFRVPEYICHQI